MTKYLVVFQPSGKRGYVGPGKTILEAARELGEDLESICGGRLTCGKCKVRIEAGSSSGLPNQKEVEHLGERAIAEGYRLACATTIEGDLLLYIPEEGRSSKKVVAKAAKQRTIDLKTAIRKYYVELTPPTLESPLGDWERLSEELAHHFNLNGLTIDYYTLGHLSKTLRQADWKVTFSVWHNRKVIAVEPGLVEQSYGLAIDIGTTTLAGYLCDLRSGEVIATEAALNPQVRYGEDVISRFAYATESPQGLERLHDAVLDGLNEMVLRLASAVMISPEDISEVTIVGNTAMHHLFLKLDPQHLGRAPFTPTLHSPLDISARHLSLKINPAANVHILPVEAGFVGADNVGVLIAEELYAQEEITLILDIGTNGEIALGNRERLLTASCAMGPALEGAHIKFGMRATAGAIEKVSIDPNSLEVKFKVVGNKRWNDQSGKVKARGICGSGIIDAIAEMLSAGIIKPSGTFDTTIGSPRLLLRQKRPEFIIARAEETTLGQEITVSQGDVREVQLAKAALYAGAKVLMSKLGINHADRVILAGAFGLHIDQEKALRMGLFPASDLDRVYSVGNAAGEGARLALLNMDKRQQAAKVARQVEYVELTVEPSFSDEFIKAMTFPDVVKSKE